jgi:hypothetical protein
MNFHLINIVWGQEYTDLLLNISLPSQLAPGNLPAFREKGKTAIYKIYTTDADAEVIKKSPVFAELSAIMPTEIILIDNFDLTDQEKYGSQSGSKYSVMVYCYQQAVRECINDNGKLVSLSPDAVFPHQFFTKLINIESTGKLAIMIFSYRVLKENFVTAITKEFYANNLSVAIPSHDLVKFSLDHLHPYSQSLFWDGIDYNTWPSHIYWNIKERGLLARCFNLHPIMLNLRGKDLIPQGTVDGQYWEQLYPNIADIYIPEDTDELFAVEMSSLNHNTMGAIATEKTSNAYEVAKWALSRWDSNPSLHADLLRQRIRIKGVKTEDINEEEWKKVEKISDKVIAEIFNYWGEELTKAGRLAEALTIYDYSIDLNPSDARTHYNLGLTLQERYKLNLKEAIKCYQKILELNPNDPEANQKLQKILSLITPSD